MKSVFSGGLATSYARAVIRWRWLVLLLVVGVFLVCLYGARRVQFAENYRVFFDESNPYLEALDAFEETYEKVGDNILVMFLPADGNVFSREFLSAMEGFTEGAWETPHAVRVTSLTNFQRTRAEGDELVVEDLVSNALQLSDQELVEIRAYAVAEPLIVKRLVSPDGDAAALNITLIMLQLEDDEQNQAVAHVQSLAAELEASHPDISVHIAGGTMLSYSFTEYTMKDMATLTPLMYLAIWILLAILLRSVTATLISVVVIIMSVVSAIGMTGWFGIEFTPPSAAMPTMVMILAVADSVHILVSILLEMRGGRPKNEAIIEAVRINASPVFLTSFTTCIGFLSMNFSGVPPLADMGNMTAVGVALAFFYSMAVLPSLASILPFRIRAESSSRSKTLL